MDKTKLLQNGSIINKIMEMDLNDDIAVKNVIDIITSHPFRNAFFLGSLLGTSMHQNNKLEKALYYYHDAHTPDDLHAYIFKQNGSFGFLVNIAESYDREECEDYWGDYLNIEDVPLPNLSYKGIEEVVRIDVSSDKNFKVRMVTVSTVVLKKETADGRFNSVPTIDVTDIMMSLHRREEGYKAIDRLTCFDDSDDNLQSSDTLENKVLNYITRLQRNIRVVGDLKAFVEGMLVGVNICHPYNAEAEGHNIISIQSFDDTLFIIAFDHVSKPTIEEQHTALESNLNNLLTQYIFDYKLGANNRNVILLAITYNTCFEPEFDSVDNIVSFRHSPEAKESKFRLESYLLELGGLSEIFRRE